MRALRWSIAPILLGLVAAPQADAGGGGGSGGGAHGSGGGLRAGTRAAPMRLVRPGFVHNPLVANPLVANPLVARGFTNNPRVGRFANPRLANTVTNGFPVWWGGAWGWPGDWGTGGYYGYANPPVQQVQAAPQVIVIRSDGDGRMTTAEATSDQGYIPGCHAIANGYHCDLPSTTR